jgi:predicted MPP superfamily phosphohydrolase
VLALEDVIGPEDVVKIRGYGRIVFHAVGDTGKGKHSPQAEVVDLMRADYDPNRPPADQPAFLLHLGDVVYGTNKEDLYRDQFYRPNNKYPGRILAVPGNHDGEINENTDPKSLAAFRHNFVAKRPKRRAAAGSSLRPAMTQPGIYFLLESPFVRIIGLYTNAADEAGFLSAEEIGSAQKDFLIDQLKIIAGKRADGDTAALVVATHHPPYSASDHPGSKEMLDDFDDAFRQAGAAPDLFLSGHAHNYQRFTRTFTLNSRTTEMPYIVAGGGGHGASPIKLCENGQMAKTPLRGAAGDHSLQQYYNGYGYLLVKATAQELAVEFYSSPPTGDGPTDSVVVDLQARKVVHETGPLDHPLQGEVERHGKHKHHQGVK